MCECLVEKSAVRHGYFSVIFEREVPRELKSASLVFENSDFKITITKGAGIALGYFGGIKQLARIYPG